MSAFSMSQACEVKSMSESEHMKSILKDVDSKGSKAEFYNFTTGVCEKIKQKVSELEIGAYMPSDETTLGLYSMYRAQGENQMASLKHVYHFLAANS